MSNIDWSQASFVKAEKSHIDGKECVEVSRVGETFGLRDSKHPEGAVLEFSLAEMAAFANGVRNGEFGV